MHPFLGLGKRCNSNGLPTEGHQRLKCPMSQIQAQQWLIIGNGVAFRNIDKEGGSSPNGGYRSNNQNWK
jgi:hypothetical protein